MDVRDGSRWTCRPVTDLRIRKHHPAGKGVQIKHAHEPSTRIIGVKGIPEPFVPEPTAEECAPVLPTIEAFVARGQRLSAWHKLKAERDEFIRRFEVDAAFRADAIQRKRELTTGLSELG